MHLHTHILTQVRAHTDAHNHTHCTCTLVCQQATPVGFVVDVAGNLVPSSTKEGLYSKFTSLFSKVCPRRIPTWLACTRTCPTLQLLSQISPGNLELVLSVQ